MIDIPTHDGSKVSKVSAPLAWIPQRHVNVHGKVVWPLHWPMVVVVIIVVVCVIGLHCHAVCVGWYGPPWRPQS